MFKRFFHWLSWRLAILRYGSITIQYTLEGRVYTQVIDRQCAWRVEEAAQKEGITFNEFVVRAITGAVQEQRQAHYKEHRERVSRN